MSAISVPLYAADGDSLYGKDFKPQTLEDDDKDGVINARDTCPSTPIGAQVDLQGCPETTTSVLSLDMKVLFDTNKYEVKPLFYGQIKRLADFLKEHSETRVVIEGYTDNVGPAEKNLTLSKNRAQAIAQILTDKFKIDPSRVTTKGYGESHPIASNDTRQGRTKNRRVIAEVHSSTHHSITKWTIYNVGEELY